jgi:methylated-DNA-[protein]-cysteine S-methyltransferase
MRTIHRSSLVPAEVVVFDSQLGWSAALGGNECLMRLTFGHRSADAALRAVGGQVARRVREFDWCPDLIGRLTDYAAGEWIELVDVPVDVAGLTPFQRRVIDLCRRIPFARTTSYAELAMRAGSPGAARAVGNVMAANRCPLVVPCHRVVNADGSIGNYSAPQGVGMKLRLLALEEQAAHCPAG